MDGVQDISLVDSDDLLRDSQLLQELFSELDSIKRTQNTTLTNFLFLQNQHPDPFSSNVASQADTVSMESSLNETSNTNSKDGRSLKLLEILLQPHILNGLLDYLVDSVEFFHNEQTLQIERNEKLISGNGETIGDPESDPGTPDMSKLALDDESNSDQKYPSDEQEGESDRIRRFVQSASDILAIDLWVILNRIIETPAIMSKLWLIVSLPNLSECSPSVTYLVRILDQLMDTNSIELLNFVRRQPNLVETILDKIEVPLLMEFFLRIIQTDKADSPTGVIEILSQQKLISKLMDILKPQPSQFSDGDTWLEDLLFFKQMAATEFIKSLVAMSSNTALALVVETNIGPNQLTRELVSRETIETMIHDIILYRPPHGHAQTNKHGINNCVGIIIELIRKNNSDYDLECGQYTCELPTNENGISEINATVMCKWLCDFTLNPPGPRDPIYLGTMLELFADNLDKLDALMSLASTAPGENANLGLTNFRISELVAELLHCSNMILLNSHRIKQIRRLRDFVRQQRSQRLAAALSDNLHFDHDARRLSFHEFQDDSLLAFDEGENALLAQGISHLASDQDSDDEEPVISSDCPFVSAERDEGIRRNPSVGDYFKIKMRDLGILTHIVRAFAAYPYNNFFHNVVFDLIQQIFNGKLNSYNSFLIVDLFHREQCRLTSVIEQSYSDCAEPRPGYMGHLVLISEEVVKFASLYKPDLISPVIVEAIMLEPWDTFVSETLTKTREMYNMVLGGDSAFEEYAQEQGPNKDLIVLGDASNHQKFMADGQYASHLDDEDDSLEQVEMPELSVQSMSPSGSIDQESPADDGSEHDFFPAHTYLDHVDTDSSDEDTEPGGELGKEQHDMEQA